MRSHKLHAWISATDSSALFINANHKGSTRQQPTSFICARLVGSVTPPPNISEQQHRSESRISLPLAYFCGEHLYADDPDSNPDGMMRSLLAQLLLAFSDFDLRTIQRMQQDLDFNDVNDLCDVFDLLVAQLPPYVLVFCFVDAISFFEDSAGVCDEANVAVQALVDIVDRTKESGCTFKLLLMSPWNSRVLYESISDQEEDVLWVSIRVQAQGGFTAFKWTDSVEAGLAASGHDVG